MSHVLFLLSELRFIDLNHLVIDFDLNHFGAIDFPDLIYKSFFSWVIYDFDLNKKKSVISYDIDYSCKTRKILQRRWQTDGLT